MNKCESETLERANEIVMALQKILLPLCIMLEHAKIPNLARSEIALGFAESKASLWGLSDALHDAAKTVRREEEHDEPTRPTA